MAIDLFSASESCGIGIMSPRISFSHDLCHSDVVPVEQYCHRSDASLLDSTFDFDFGVSGVSFEQEPPFSADDLFFDGKILPCQIRDKPPVTILPPPLPSKPKQSSTTTTHHHPLPHIPPPLPPPSSSPNTDNTCTNIPTTTDDSKKESLKEIMATTTDSEDKAPSKSFWRFNRSNSLNSSNGHKRSLICSLPLLSRSNSTGSSSSTNSKRQPLLKDSQKHSHKPTGTTTTTTPPGKSSSLSSQSLKPPLMKKKNSLGSYGNGLRINPVLNVPPPYIARGTANLFGLGSLFCSGKDKSKKK